MATLIKSRRFVAPPQEHQRPESKWKRLRTSSVHVWWIFYFFHSPPRRVSCWSRSVAAAESRVFLTAHGHRSVFAHSPMFSWSWLWRASRCNSAGVDPRLWALRRDTGFYNNVSGRFRFKRPHSGSLRVLRRHQRCKIVRVTGTQACPVWWEISVSVRLHILNVTLTREMGLMLPV